MSNITKTKHKTKALAFLVKARYEGEIDDRREQRIHAAFDRCGVRVGVFSTADAIEPGEVRVGFSDVDWSQGENDDGEIEHQIEIYVGDRERAVRLVSELKACGMIGAMEPAP